jgi:hypothetical protein
MHEHINIERTLKELGTDVNNLKPNSYKPVYRICEVCKCEQVRKYQHVNVFKQYKCLDCSNKLNAKKNVEIKTIKIKEFWLKNGHSRLGKKHTDASKLAMSISQRNIKRPPMSEEALEKCRNRMLGDKNPFYGKRHTEETRAIISKKSTKNARRGKECNFYGKSYYSKHINFTDKKGRVFKLKSSWEVKVAEFLDRENINWDYESEKFPIQYWYENVLIEGTYTPDFFLENGDIWEVKGYWRKDALIKYQQFLIDYPGRNISILDKKKLVEMKIL